VTTPKLSDDPLRAPLMLPPVRHGVPVIEIVPVRAEPACVHWMRNVPLDESGVVFCHVPFHVPLSPDWEAAVVVVGPLVVPGALGGTVPTAAVAAVVLGAAAVVLSLLPQPAAATRTTATTAMRNRTPYV